ncbi:uncharacterized protein LOC144452249 [Glandiceps talaboti]
MLSPSRSCEIYGSMLDRKTKKVTEKKRTKEGKLQRIKHKEKRAKRIAATEVREGVTYQQDIGLSESYQNEEIPEPIKPPTQVPIDLGQYTPVIFDIETTSAYSTAEITQLSARYDQHQFEEYILPRQPISQIASEKTHLTIVGGKLCYKGQPVQCVPKETCLTKFLAFLKNVHNPILVGHNCRSFDCRYLIKSLQDTSLLDQFLTTVAGFVDSLPLFKSILPGRNSYSQESLANDYVGQIYDAHNATADVIMLQRLIETCNVSLSTLLENSFTSHWIVQHQHYKHQQLCNYTTLVSLVDNKVLSKSMAQKVAGSGLCYQHLHLAYQRDGFNSLRDLFSEDSGGTVRVTKSDRIINNVCNFFNSLT